jgi:tRNA threonylcarbamoyladenosine modification (KEOPS) complex  Pcc1 subunit
MTLQGGAGGPHRAELFFPFPPSTARAVHGALAPETRADVPKTAGRAALEAGGVRVSLVAEDLASLRAAVNSYLRWVDAAEKAARIGGAR